MVFTPLHSRRRVDRDGSDGISGGEPEVIGVDKMQNSITFAEKAKQILPQGWGTFTDNLARFGLLRNKSS